MTFRVAIVGIGTESSTFTPQLTGDDDFWVTHGTDLAALCRAHGVAHSRHDDLDLAAALAPSGRKARRHSAKAWS